MQIIDEVINSTVNTQIGRELHNANQYLAIAAYFKDQALDNIAAVFQKQAEDERSHAQKFIDFLIDLRGQVKIPSIDPPINEFASAIDAVRSALALELETTQNIYNMVDIAQKLNNHMFYNFLLWFINEQQEEIATANDRLDIISRNANTLELADLKFAENQD